MCQWQCPTLYWCNGLTNVMCQWQCPTLYWCNGLTNVTNLKKQEIPFVVCSLYFLAVSSESKNCQSILCVLNWSCVWDWCPGILKLDHLKLNPAVRLHLLSCTHFVKEDILTVRVLKQLTNSMHQHPSREADCRSASQEVPFLLCNTKVCYCVYKSLPLDSVLSQMNPVHILKPYF
jgi:hypothetical protein